MTNIKVIKGDLLNSVTSGIIIHGCNTTNLPAGGFAGFCFMKYPKALAAHHAYTGSDASPGLLGTFTHSFVTPSLVVANLYTQTYPGAGSLSYEAIRNSVKKLVVCIKLGLFGKIEPAVVFPKVGAGIAGGDWEIISSILSEELQGLDATLYVLE